MNRLMYNYVLLILTFNEEKTLSVLTKYERSDLLLECSTKN